MNDIAKRLRQIREQKKISIAEFAKLLEEKEHRIRDIENGKQKIPPEIIVKLKKILNINPDWLLTGEGEVYLKNEDKNKIFVKELFVLQIDNQDILRNEYFSKLLDKNIETLKKIKSFFENLTEQQKLKEEAFYYKLIAYFYEIDAEISYLKYNLKNMD